ncbi:zf-DHHC-domain-containing protein [Amylostereum chailletii]|nr:zf-DHHC-domain-containing protein [Amylostereum chailletii]
MPSAAARCVFACFKRVERWGDRITGAAGPVFITLAVALFSGAALCFLDVILPSLPWPVLTAPPCLLIILNLFAHYYYACTISPGFVDHPPEVGGGRLWAKKTRPRAHARGVSWSEELNVTPAAVTRCNKCGQAKPERAHHCRICNRCVLKFDHHCPNSRSSGINQCVGINNERHFVLFMVYLVLGTFAFIVTGWPYVFDAMGFNYTQDTWTYFVPPVIYAMTTVLCLVMCLAVSVMLGWHLWSIAIGETSVESHDHDVYRSVARGRGESFINSYDLGKRKNLALFFNIGKGRYPWYTLILPLRIPPYTDGRAWARRPGLERHPGVRAGEELTDDEE